MVRVHLRGEGSWWVANENVRWGDVGIIPSSEEGLELGGVLLVGEDP